MRSRKWIELQRERAFALLELRGINQRLEGLRPRLRAEGAELPLDGFTAKLGGTDAEPGLSGLWIEAYIDQAMAERVIDPDELDEAA